MKFYAVKEGREPGIYHTWEEAEKEVSGFSGAIHKSFKNREDADEFMGYSTYGSESKFMDSGFDSAED